MLQHKKPKNHDDYGKGYGGRRHYYARFLFTELGVLNLPGNTNLMNSKFKTVATTA